MRNAVPPMASSTAYRVRDATPPKVVHVVVAGEIGGAERFLADLASRPDQTGADHCIALMTSNPALRHFFQDVRLSIRDRGPVRENPLAYLMRSFGREDVGWLTGVFEAERADIVHVHTFASHVIGVRSALKVGLPVVRTEHGVRHYLDITCSPFRRWTLARTSALAAVSKYVADFVAGVAPEMRDRIEVIRNGIDTEYFSVGAWPSGPFTFSIASRLEPVKRIDLAIMALTEAADAKLTIIGDGSSRSSLERLVKKNGLHNRVHFAGYRPDVRPLVALSHAAVNCCSIEGLGLSMLEAQAMGRPVVAFNAGGASEIVRDGNSGWLSDEISAHGIGRLMAVASRDRKRAQGLGLEGRRFVERECGIASMCESYARLYQRLRGRVRPRLDA